MCLANTWVLKDTSENFKEMPYLPKPIKNLKLLSLHYLDMKYDTNISVWFDYNVGKYYQTPPTVCRYNSICATVTQTLYDNHINNPW